MLEGKMVNLRIMEKEDLPLFQEWNNNPEFGGDYFPPTQNSRAELEKALEANSFELKFFIIEKKDGSKIGYIFHLNMLTYFVMGKLLEIGYALLPSERGKGYSTEAAKLMVDYLFLSKDVARIQATTHSKNVISQKVLEKVGFKKEGTLRKPVVIRGEWTDMTLYSILREEWKEPKILTRTEKK